MKKNIYYLSLILLTYELSTAESCEPKTPGEMLEYCRVFNPKLYNTCKVNRKIRTESLFSISFQDSIDSNNISKDISVDKFSELKKYVRKKDPSISVKESEDFIKGVLQHEASVAEPFFELEKNSEVKKDIHDVFNYLKCKMGISEDISLWCLKTENVSCFYKCYLRSVHLSPMFDSINRASQLFILLHELSHAKQHQQVGLERLLSKSSYYIERQADTHAICAIKCPVCSQIIADQLLRRDVNYFKRGYLSGREMEQLSVNKSMKDLCCAHKKDTVPVKELVLLVQEKKDISHLLLDGDGFSVNELSGSRFSDLSESSRQNLSILLNRENTAKLSEYVTTVSFEQ
jgi:hypothetical protein